MPMRGPGCRMRQQQDQQQRQDRLRQQVPGRDLPRQREDGGPRSARSVRRRRAGGGEGHQRHRRLRRSSRCTPDLQLLADARGGHDLRPQDPRRSRGRDVGMRADLVGDRASAASVSGNPELQLSQHAWRLQQPRQLQHLPGRSGVLGRGQVHLHAAGREEHRLDRPSEPGADGRRAASPRSTAGAARRSRSSGSRSRPST